jgi:hypothetical protein
MLLIELDRINLKSTIKYLPDRLLIIESDP